VKISLGVLFCYLLLPACTQRMDAQPKYETYEAAPAFPQRQSALPAPEHAVPLAQEEPPPEQAYTMELLQRGRERYGIFCAPCHGAAGYGDGPIVQHGFPAPPSYHQARLRRVPERYFVDVITQGHGLMYSYADRVPPADRRAIAAYIRALQLSQHAPLAAFPDLIRQVEEGTE
jgi:mono/diheme cytochrome c family protein